MFIASPLWQWHFCSCHYPIVGPDCFGYVGLEGISLFNKHKSLFVPFRDVQSPIDSLFYCSMSVAEFQCVLAHTAT